MKKGIGIILLSMVMVFVAQSSLASDKPSPSLRTMATILNYLNHYPGDADRPKLKDIADNQNTPAYERTIASAILNLEHKATSADKAKLMKVMSDNDAPQAAKDIAKVVHDLNHKASDADKKVLKQYMW